MKKFLRQISWQPRRVEVFAGRLNYRRYSNWDRRIIRFIMWLTKGPTDPHSDIEYTDWQQVETFAEWISTDSTDRVATGR